MIQPSFGVKKGLLLGCVFICSGLQCSQQPDTSEAVSKVPQLTQYQYLTALLTPDGNKFIPFMSARNTPAPLGPRIAAKSAHASLTLRDGSHPHQIPGSELFPNNSGLANAFEVAAQKFADTVKVVTDIDTGKTIELHQFVMLFRKFQFLVLNELYTYLIDVYSTFNLTHPKKPGAQTQQAQTSTSKPTKISIDAYLAQEYGTTVKGTFNKPTALNKKSIIVGQLLNLIQAQMYYIAQQCYPLMPQAYAMKAAIAALQHDTSVDPLLLLIDLSQPLVDYVTDDQKKKLSKDEQQKIQADGMKLQAEVFAPMQQSYLDALQAVLNFFSKYTAYLNKPDPTSKIPGTNAFASLAEHIAGVKKTKLAAYNKQITDIQKLPPVGADGKSLRVAHHRDFKKKIRANPALGPINPPLFHYDQATLRAIKLIPQVAAELPATVQSIDLPDQLVQAAANGTPAKAGNDNPLGYPIAEMDGGRLYINMSSQQQSFYRQEIKRQPDWLNNKTGVIAMLRAILGDFKQLIGMNILTPCVEALMVGKRDMTYVQLGTCSSQLVGGVSGAAPTTPAAGAGGLT